MQLKKQFGFLELVLVYKLLKKERKMPLKTIKNKFDYFLRQKLKFTRGHFPIQNEGKNDLFELLDEQRKKIALEKEIHFYNHYNLKDLKNSSTKRNYLENLYILELLQNQLDLTKAKNNISILDIGSKNWFYAKGEYQFFKNHSFKKSITLTGIEIDAYRVYSSFYSRYDSAQNNIKGLNNANYISGDLLNHFDKYDYITWFFPFLTKEPLLYWGLPLDFYKPKQLLLHAFSLLNKNGTMIIMNQGEEEYIIQKTLLLNNNINFIEINEFKSSFLDYDHKRYCLKIIK